MPRGKKHTAEQVIGKLREAEIVVSKGSTTKETAKGIGVTEQAFFRCRNEDCRMRPEQAKRDKLWHKTAQLHICSQLYNSPMLNECSRQELLVDRGACHSQGVWQKLLRLFVEN